DVVVGNKHGEKSIDGTYGVQLKDNGIPVAEVEGGEVLVDDKVVFSDRMMYDDKNSYADKMKQIAVKRGKLEDKLDNTKTPFRRNSVERRLAALNMAEEALY